MNNEKIIHDINLLNNLIEEEIVDDDMLDETINCFKEKGAILIRRGFNVEDALEFLVDIFDVMIDEYEGGIEED